MDLNIENNINNFDDFIKKPIHVRVQQQGRRKITIIQDLESDLDLKRICKNMKKIFSCNGCVVEDEKLGEIIQLQGNQSDNVKLWLINNEIINLNEIDRIIIHGI